MAVTHTDVERLLGRRVVALEQRPHAYGTSAPLDEVTAELDDGTVLALVLKGVGRPGAKPAFLHDPRREIETYRRILEPAGLGTPRFYGATGSRLAIERVDGVPLWQIGELETWCAVARWLRVLHEALAPFRAEPFLLRYDAAHYRGWLDRAQAIAGDLGPVARGYDDVVEGLLALPTTVVHGELYPSNVLIAATRICAVDWETTAAGPGLVDLAALTAGWEDKERAAIAAAYGDIDPRALDLCRLYLAVRWLGWAPDWRPPAEHAHDWRAEALELAERIAA